MVEEKREQKWVPPYIAFTTLTDLLTRMEKSQGMPPQIDRSYLESYSGGYQSQVLAALKSLGLIGDQGEVQDTLTELVEKPADRKRLMRGLVESYYPEVVRLGSINATQAQLTDWFDKLGITGDTRRKAIAFYIKAAKYADVKISPNFKVPAVSAGTRPTRPRKPRGQQPPTPPAPPTPPPGSGTIPGLDPALVAWLAKEPGWEEGAKASWFTTFKAIYQGLNPKEKIE